MAKPAKPAHEEEAERIFRDHLLARYIRVVGRVGDCIVIEPRGDCFISLMYTVSGAMERKLRVLAGPSTVKPAAKAK